MRLYTCTTLLALFGLLVALPGCPKGDDTADTEADADTDTDADTDADGDSDLPFAPAEGDWVISRGEVLKDGCGIKKPPAKEIPVVVTAEGKGAFSYDDGEFVFHCHLTDMDFVCDPVEESNTDLGSYDATLIGTDTVAGSFESETSCSGTATLNMSCEGADCGLVEKKSGFDFPCEVVMPFTGATVAR
jgi:hypothetical protein